MTTRSGLLRDNIIWVLGVHGFPPTEADGILYFDFSRHIYVLMAGVLGLFKDIPVILFVVLVSDEF